VTFARFVFGDADEAGWWAVTWCTLVASVSKGTTMKMSGCVMGTSTDGAEDEVSWSSAPFNHVSEMPATCALRKDGAALEGVNHDKPSKHT